MRFSLLLFLMAFAGAALAGEDSTDRWHGVGPAFYEVKGGLARFAAGEPVAGDEHQKEAPCVAPWRV